MKKKRDILFLCQFFYPEYISSAQLPYDTVLALRDAGFSVGALCGYPREYAEGGKVPTKEDANGIHIHRLKYIQTGRAGFLGRIINYFSFTFHVLLHLPEIAKYRAVVKKNNMKKRWAQRSTYRFYKCPQCKQTVRVPKGRGKICITCPKCKTEFIKKS